MIKRSMFVVVLAVALVALVAAPAFAEGYNNPAGVGDYSRATGYLQGPHGGYTTTTNKCQDCHSTHYAFGSYMLLRANSAEAACDFCHGGGGGSSINIMMDNDYRDGTFDTAESSAVSTTTTGYGTGHTLGYQGNAPADINPAYSAGAGGFACFDCHTPHGNSARVMTTFANPGRAMSTSAPTTFGDIYASDASVPVAEDVALTAANFTTYLGASGGFAIAETANGAPGQGNFIFWTGSAVQNKPIWPTGRFLLLMNPDVETSGTVEVADTVVGDEVGTASTLGWNKLAVDWIDPLGPADGVYGPEQDSNNTVYTGGVLTGFRDESTFPVDGPGVVGFLGLSEFCMDCHDGAAGASTQSAVVWRGYDSTYAVAYSHDAQPRH